MSLFTLLQIIVALIFIYFIVSLLVLEVQEQFAAIFKLRAKNLHKAIEIFIGKKLRDELYEIDRHINLDKKTNRKTTTLFSAFFENKIGPSYIEADIFAESLLNLLNSKLDLQDRLSLEQELLFISVDGVDKSIIEKLESIKKKDVDQDILDRLIEIAFTTKLKHDNPTVANFANEIAKTFSEVMERTSGVYKRNAKGLSIILGIFAAIAFNIDSIYIVNKLYKDPDLADNFNMMAENVVEEHRQCLGLPESTPNEETIDKCQEDLEAKVKEIEASFPDDLVLPIGWNFEKECEEERCKEKKEIPWSISNLPNKINQVWEQVSNQIGKNQGGWWIAIPGWLISATALAMGAPFWFDLLTKVLNIRNTLRSISPSGLRIKFPLTSPSKSTSQKTSTITSSATIDTNTFSNSVPVNLSSPITIIQPTQPIQPTQSKMEEIRGVWLASHYNSDVLKSRDNIERALDFLEETGFNTLFVAVWNRGYTAFESKVMAEHGFTKQDPEYVRLGIDPLQEVISLAKDRNFAVFPWFEYGFAASPEFDGGHILRKYTQWKAIDKSGNKVRHGDLTWMNSLDDEVQQFMTDLVVEVVEKYDITGIQGCDRLPAMPHLGGYDKNTIEKYGSKPSDTKDEEWLKFRANLLTDYVINLRRKIKKTDPNCIFSIAPSPYKFGYDNLLQDSDRWVKEGLVDFLCPQFYRSNFLSYQEEIDKLKIRIWNNKDLSENQKKELLKKYVPGIAFKANKLHLKSSDIIQAVQYNRQCGLGGEVFFFYYKGLLENNNAIAKALKLAGKFSQDTVVVKPPLV